MPSTTTATAVPSSPRRRFALWVALLALLAVAQSLLVVLTLSYENSRAQQEADDVATDAATRLRQSLLRPLPQLQAMAVGLEGAPSVADLFQTHRALRRLEWRAGDRTLRQIQDSPWGPPPFAVLGRDQLALAVDDACSAAQRDESPAYSRSYYAPLPGGTGQELLDLCLPIPAGIRSQGDTPSWLVATIALAPLLEQAAAEPALARHELQLVGGDGARLARAGSRRGAGTYLGEQRIDLPGSALLLRTNSAAGRPSLIPHLNTALVIGLSLLLFAVAGLLARDTRRRAAAERALADELAFRQAMESSLITGLRARDLDGRVTYANAAFCRMVGIDAESLQSTPADAPPPYWPPEHAAEYQARQAERRRAGVPRESSALGFESVFMRADGERFPVMIYDAPLVDGSGHHRGWMSAVLDMSAQRRAEELSRQQQERLQAGARLAAVGEMASLLSHELNQPLAAIASYASGCLNLVEPQPGIDRPSAGPSPAGSATVTVPVSAAQLRPALERIAEQAERAGRVIRSVHSLVARRRPAEPQTLACAQLVEAVLPLVRMQARKCGARIEIALPEPSQRPLHVSGDRTMLEQVLLNLSRNALQAMDDPSVPSERRVLRWRIDTDAANPERIEWACIDGGLGLPPDFDRQRAQAFFTTKPEGMGLGLSLCRTVLEQHGSQLHGEPAVPGPGAMFRFSLARAPGPGSEAGVAASPRTIGSP